MSRYQSFGASAASDSAAKLEAIKLPKDLTGKSFLDLGCNEGFFCIEAKRRGATRIVGIDRNEEYIRRARERDSDIEFLHQGWDELPDGRFDVIIMLSALHYEPRPRELLRLLYDRLTDDGLLILEVGVAAPRGTSRVWTQRKSTVFHPTWDMLYYRYLEPFAFRVVGRSVDQPGDPVPRWVVHCRRRMTNVLLVTGRSRYGKSTLARQLGADRRVVVEVDAVIRRLLDSATRFDTPLLRVIQEFKDARVRSFSEIVEGIVDAGLSDDFAGLLVDHIPLDEDLVILEGYGLRDKVLESVIRRLKGKAIVWTCERLPAPDAIARFPREAPEEVEHLRSQISRMVHTGDVHQLRADYERQVARLNTRIVELTGEADTLQNQMSRLKGRRSVKAALALAKWSRPMLQNFRRFQDKQ